MTIDYTYDNLYRLTGADYSSGDFYHYAYDAVGNRLSLTTAAGETTYTYDEANRLTAVNGQAVTWDNNGREAPLRRRSLPPKRGNMRSDGMTTYQYNTANKLTGVTQGTSNIVYAYSGLGDRLRQTVDGTATNYTLDLNAGLTQVLQDGTNTYLYGPSTGSGQATRISQIAETQTGYFLPDALGSMRQMTDSAASLSLARNYDPYGNVISSSGAGDTVYGYTGEKQSGGLVHLRARDYASALGRFTSRDTWEGDNYRPGSFNKWLYVNDNPILNTDPSGNVMNCDHTHPETCIFPEIKLYNEKQYPSSAITFTGNDLTPPAIFWYRNLSTKTYEEKLIKPGTNQAQFIPNAYENWMHDETIDNNGNKVTYHSGLCGEISIAAILGKSANEIVDRFVTFRVGTAPDYTGSNELKKFIDNEYSDILITYDLQSVNDWVDKFDDIANILPEWLQNGYVIAGITISGSTGQLRNGYKFPDVNNRLFSLDGSAKHWIVITGISNQWNEGSNWKWIRIFNPFDDETEYYWWEDFKQSWIKQSGSMLRISKK